jgi:hypothetical protein
MKQYDGYLDFYHAYEAERKRLVTIDDIDNLIKELRDEGCKIRESRDGRISVRSLEEIKASETKRKAIQALGASRFTKLGATFPKDVASQFAEACRKLGYKQSEILMPVIKDTIKEAELM